MVGKQLDSPRGLSLAVLGLSLLATLVPFSPVSAAEIQWHRHWNIEVDVPDSFSRPTFYRTAVCPDGDVVVMISDRSSGHLQLIRANGSVAFKSPLVDSLAETTAVACTADGRIYTAGGGWLRSSEVQDSQLVPVGFFFISGGATRILVVEDQTFVLGPWRLNETRTIVRRFRLPEGKFEGSLMVDLPVSIGNFVNRLAYEGFLLWDASQERVLYIPANPVGFYAFSVTGERLARIVPQNTHVQPVSDRSANLAPVHPRDVDHVMAAAVFPTGNILLFVVPGRGQISAPQYTANGGFKAHLELYNSAFQLVADNIPYPRGVGLLVGADREGNLYFANPRPMEARVEVAKLSASELLQY